MCPFSLKEDAHIVTQAIAKDEKMPLAMVGGSDTKPMIALPPSADEKTEFGADKAEKTEEHKAFD